MSSIIKTATSLACLAAVALASPLHAGSSNLLSRQSDTDCPAGKVFYVCANGYRGCYVQDPCALPSITTIAAAITSATSAPAIPSATSVPAAACSAGVVRKPTMYNLHPAQAELAQPSVSYLETQLHGSDPALAQAAVFSGIPATAKTCTLSWAQADAAARTFTVEKSGLISVLPLTGFPAAGAPVSSASVAAFEPADAEVALTPDFTFWDQTKTATNHTAGPVPCAENIYLKVSQNPVNGDGHVYLQQDEKNGFYISYTC
ncbi:hypothetical protein F4819DRAFT_503287 [Hypoxylon fuscum]|nr:hypothetical protein F4819DRAFT_503287 [Hypoxylon fuscum]